MMWRIAFLFCIVFAVGAAQSISGSAQFPVTDDILMGNEGMPKFDPTLFPPQCDPRKLYPDGKLPDDFRENYTTPEHRRFEACVWADAKAHAKGKEILFYMPESHRRTACSAAATYPDHHVRPAFYAYPSPAEFDRYIDCVIAEAHRDGDRVRQASYLSFPRIGACYVTRVNWIGNRFAEGRPDRDAGTQLGFVNKLWLVDYGLVRPVARSRIGDPIRACVADLPKGCNAYDLRGIGYKVRNLRTGEIWTMGDSQHVCRGA